MRSQLFLIPAALIAATPAQAKVFLSIQQAQRLMYPGATLLPHAVTLSEDQAAGVMKDAGAILHDRRVKAWRASTGGWFIIDQVEGKEDWITYAVALTDDGVVKRIEILECLSDYDTITMPEWRAQFTGRKAGDEMGDIETISGSTLSSRHVIEGVKRILSTYALVLRYEKI